MRFTIFGGAAALLAVVGLLYQHVDAITLLAWLSMGITTYGARYWLWNAYQSQADFRDLRYWKTFITVLMGSTGVLWASMCLIFDVDWPTYVQILFGLALAVVFVFSVFTYSSLFLSVVAYATPITLGVIVLIIKFNHAQQLLIIPVFLLCVFAVLAASLRGHQLNQTLILAAVNATALNRKLKTQLQKLTTQLKLMRFELIKLTDRAEIKESLVQASHEAVFLIDVESRCITECNRSASRLFRLPPSAIVGKEVDKFFISMETGAAVREQFDLLRSEQQSEAEAETEIMLGRTDGSGVMCELRSTRIQNRRKQMVRISLLDITTRKRVQMRLEESETRYRTLFDNNPSICITLSTTGYILDINTKGAIHLGFPDGRALEGRLVGTLLNQGDKIRSARYLRSAASEPGKTFRWEHSVVGAEGQMLRVRSSLIAIKSGHDLQLLLVWEDITETDELNRKLRWQASHDSLTGLLNRQAMEQNLQVLINDGAPDQTHSFCLIDLDQFKIVNDTSGHQAGDELLRQVSKLMQSTLRERDLLARIGGDEFAVILIDCPEYKAIEIAERLRELIDEFRFQWENNSFKIGLSLGLVTFEPKTWRLERILSSADAACYLAKDRGKNRIEVFTNDDATGERQLGDMRSAATLMQHIEEGRFSLVTQVIHPLTVEGQIRCELLVRMKNDSGDLVSPGSFMGALERFNVVTALDRWVIEEASHWIEKHQAQLTAVDSVAINVSAQSVIDERFEQFVVEALRSKPDVATKLVFEIQETALLSNLTRVREFIDTLKGHGIRFAVDDFGSGLTAFDYLKQTHFEYIKIDGRFTRHVDADPFVQAMLRSIHEIATLLQLRTVAESVESDEVLGWLRAHKIDYAQGYVLSAPEPTEQFLKSLKNKVR